ncbi:MAG: hypothetical protein E6Q71_06105 [Pseudomonas sp.]|nr:MAG: hypothetical protein E6Q71_06105 [Pseudomonas sp.]
MNKYQTFVPKAFDMTELNQRIADAQAQHDRHKVLYAPASQALTEYDDLVKDGYVRSTEHPVLTHSLDVMQAWLQITLIKPKKVIQKEMEQIAIDVEELYRAEIKADQAEALKRMQRRLLIEAQEKQQKDESERLAQLEAEALAEAAQILGLNGENA